ncbi:MAG TPA: VOC family protein [Candidatus Acidoferrum sp.]|nr:VOC family protein [Candidatus Acidoferrum sp.]
MQCDTYLFFNGNCEAALHFYAELLGGKIEAMLTHEGSPAESTVPPEWQKKILHARMKIGNTVLMASDAPPGRQHPAGGFSLSLGLKDPAEGERIFNKLAEGGAITMPFQETFWAQRFGMLKDRFGIPWMINVEAASAKPA